MNRPKVSYLAASIMTDLYGRSLAMKICYYRLNIVPITTLSPEFYMAIDGVNI